MDTKVLEYVIAIAEEKSVARAAERFYLSHQALYRHLKKVEEELGTPLFVRGPDGMQLTPAGILFRDDAQAILYTERELEKTLASMRRRQKKLIRLMLDYHFQNRFVRKVIPRFQAEFPEFTLEVSACNAPQARKALSEGMADLAVFDSVSPQANDLEYLAFSGMELLLAFPRDYDGPADVPGLKQAVEQGMFITLFPVGTTARIIEEQQLAAHQIYPARILEGAVQNSISQISAGNACGILPDVFCTPEVRSHIRVGASFYKIYNVIAYPPNASPTGAALDLMQIIIDEFPKQRLQ